MTTTQLSGMRMMVDALHGSEKHGNRIITRTAREMALAPHNLSPRGMLADEPNGDRWGWSDRLELWVLYEGPSYDAAFRS